MVLNELSFSPPAVDEVAARKRMSQLIQTMICAVQRGISRLLRTHGSALSAELAPDYFLASWVKDESVDIEEQRFFKRLATKSPFLEDLPEVEHESRDTEFTVGSRVAEGLGAAHLLGDLTVSLASDAAWSFGHVDVVMTWVEDQSGVLTELSESVEVVHASRVAHINEHTEWIKERLRDTIEDGADLWERRERLFPSLTFCGTVRRQIDEVYPGTPLFKQIIKRFFELNDYCTTWTGGAFDFRQLPCKASEESETTMQQFGQLREFECPNGERQRFEWHVRLTPHAWRLHFLPVPKDPDDDSQPNGTIMIGYVGRHLRTAGE